MALPKGKKRKAKKWSEVTYEDKGLAEMIDNLLLLKKIKTKVGFVPPASRAKYLDGTSVAKVAAIMEYGSDHTPARSYMRVTIFENSERIKAFENEQIREILAGRQTNEEAMEKIGQFILALFKRKLNQAASWAKPLDPETLRQKGGGAPLHDTLLLAKSLSYRVAAGRKLIATGR